MRRQGAGGCAGLGGSSHESDIEGGQTVEGGDVRGATGLSCLRRFEYKYNSVVPTTERGGHPVPFAILADLIAVEGRR